MATITRTVSATLDGVRQIHVQNKSRITPNEHFVDQMITVPQASELEFSFPSDFTGPREVTLHVPETEANFVDVGLATLKKDIRLYPGYPVTFDVQFTTSSLFMQADTGDTKVHIITNEN